MPVRPILLVSAVAGACLLLAASSTAPAGTRSQSTQLISRAYDGTLPNASSTHAVISGDRRFARLIAFQSSASDLVRGDRNGEQDVFVVVRGGRYGNDGAPWRPGRTLRVSQSRGGRGGNGRSYAPAVDGGFDSKARCVAFLSEASNLTGGDTNRLTDAFLSRGPGRSLTRMTLPGGRQASRHVTDVTVSGDCSHVAFVSGRALYVWSRGRSRRLATAGSAYNPQFATGRSDDLVFNADGGAYLSRGARKRPKLVAPGGRNPVFDDVERQMLAYEIRTHGRPQIGRRELGKRQRIVSACGSAANSFANNPVIGNTGHFVAFETGASNLCTRASRAKEDRNGLRDVYLFSESRGLTLVQSVLHKGEAAGGQRPGMSYYANYIVFDTPAPIASARARDRQVYMRYLGPV